MTTRIGPGGAWRTTTGPNREPIRHPRPNTTTAVQCTGATQATYTDAWGHPQKAFNFTRGRLKSGGER